jgi:uncharacterized protein (TIGR02246 family)
MTESADVQSAIRRLEDLEAITRLKYKYIRCVDTKQYSGLAECFAQDATATYEGGKHNLVGRDAIMDFLRRSLPAVITAHHVHHPEIEITGAATARATWALEDYVIDLKSNYTLHGAAFYEDEYVKTDGQWKIKHTGFKRIYWERWSRAELKSLQLIENMHASSQKST